MIDSRTLQPDEIDALITKRIIMFHDELVRRGQILPMPHEADPVEVQ